MKNSFLNVKSFFREDRVERGTAFSEEPYRRTKEKETTPVIGKYLRFLSDVWIAESGGRAGSPEKPLNAWRKKISKLLGAHKKL